MKILVVSLLRLGDVVLATPVIRGLRAKYPEAEIDLLMNSQFNSLAPLLPHVASVYTFDREVIQKSLGEVDRAAFEGFDRVRSLIDTINANKYELIVNLTQNRLSGWLMSAFDSRKKVGLVFDKYGRPDFGSPWLRHLNEHADPTEGDHEVFHFVDVFQSAVLFDQGPFSLQLQESEAGRAGALGLLGEKIKPQEYLLIQPLTSDLKKDWGFENFVETLELFQASRPGVAVVVLGAPSEEKRISGFVERLTAKGITVIPAICDLQVAFSLVKQARLILTGDTSIKHLAAAAGRPILELSLGSSDFRRTGAYFHGSIIIQSRELCAPCQHSKPCHRQAHFCAQRIAPAAAALVLGQLYAGEPTQLRAIAEEFADDISIYRVDVKTLGHWIAYDVTDNASEMTIGRWMDHVCAHIYLRALGREDRFVEIFSRESLGLEGLFQNLFATTSKTEWRHLFQNFEKRSQTLETWLRGTELQMQWFDDASLSPGGIKKMVRLMLQLREKLRGSPLLAHLGEEIEGLIEDQNATDFVRLRKIRESMNSMKLRSQVELKLIRHMKNSMEKTE